MNPSQLAAVSNRVRAAAIIGQVIDIKGGAFEHQTINQTFSDYAYTLAGSEVARTFLSNHGVNDMALLERLGIGFSDRSLGERLPKRRTLEGDYIRGVLQRYELIRATGGEAFRGALTFPYLDENGDVTGAYGWRPGRWLRPGTPRELYWSRQPECLFNLDAIWGFQEVILCANAFEAVILMSAGKLNVVATLGPRGFSEEQLLSLEAAGVSRVTIAFGNTDEENRAARLIAQALEFAGIESSKLTFPEGMNARTLVCSRGSEALRFVLNGARRCRQTYENLVEDLGYGH